MATTFGHPPAQTPVAKTGWTNRLLHSKLPEISVLLLATLTRCWRLDYHSLWFDEAVSMKWARSDASYIWNVTLQLVQEKHPPAYYLMLHFWASFLELFGLHTNDTALRLLGVLFGVATVGLLMGVAGKQSGRTTALLAGALAAVSPALVWYSQELRMFQPATTAIVAAAYSLWVAWNSTGGRRRMLAWSMMVAAWLFALYSYLFSAFVLPAAGISLLGLWWLETLRDRQRQPAEIRVSAARRFVEGVVALLVTGILFLPLARNAWLSNANDSTPGRAFDAFLPNLWHQLQIATFWRVDWPGWLLTTGLVFGAVFVLLGLTLPWPRQRRGRFGLFTPDLLFLWAWIATPLLVGNVLLARNETIFGEDRYFLFLVPFVLWAAARGIVAIAAWTGHVKLGAQPPPAVRGQSGWPTLIVVAIVGGSAVLWLAAALPRLWTPAMAREDWRTAAHYIATYQLASPGLPGAAVAHIDYTRLPLERYLRQSSTGIDLAVFFPFGGALEPDDIDSVVAPPLLGLEKDGIATLWLTQSHLEGMDDARVVEGWLNSRYPIVTEQYPAGIKLSGYAVASQFDQLPTLSADAVYPNKELAPGLRLAACEILTPEVTATDERLHPPSGWVHVRLWWEATGEITDDYVATVQAIGPEGVWGDRLYRENEALRKWPAHTWVTGTIVRDEIDVNLNPVMPPGSYPIIVGLRDRANNETGDKVACGNVTVVR